MRPTRGTCLMAATVSTTMATMLCGRRTTGRCQPMPTWLVDERSGGRSRSAHPIPHTNLSVRTGPLFPPPNLDLIQHRPELPGHEDPITGRVIRDAIRDIDGITRRRGRR